MPNRTTTQPAQTMSIEVAPLDHIETAADVPAHSETTYRAIIWDNTGATPRIADIADGRSLDLRVWLAHYGWEPPTGAFTAARNAFIAKLSA